MSYKVDDRLNSDGRLIHRAAGVLDASSLARTMAENHAPRSAARRALERLADDLKDVAWEMRQHNESLKPRKDGYIPRPGYFVDSDEQ